jgi:hypothetical protein
MPRKLLGTAKVVTYETAGSVFPASFIMWGPLGKHRAFFAFLCFMNGIGFKSQASEFAMKPICKHPFCGEFQEERRGSGFAVCHLSPHSFG